MASDNVSQSVMTRQQAKAAGLKRFYSGIPCAKGHVAERGTANGKCLVCGRDEMRAKRGSDPVRITRLAHAKALPIPENMRDHPIITRAEAMARGLPRYWPGRACVNGHFSERMTPGKQCLACHRERRAIVRATNPGNVKAVKAASYKKHREKTIAKVAAYAEANAEVISKRRSAHHAVNRDRINAKMAAYAKANRDVMRVGERKRRCRKKNATGSHTLAEIRALEIAQGGMCAIDGCGLRLADGYHVDHWMPLARGGSNFIDNIKLLCPPTTRASTRATPTSGSVRWA